MKKEYSFRGVLKLIGLYILYRITWTIGMTVGMAPAALTAVSERMQQYAGENGGLTHENVITFYNSLMGDTKWFVDLLTNSMPVCLAVAASFTLVLGSVVCIVLRAGRRRGTAAPGGSVRAGVSNGAAAGERVSNGTLYVLYISLGVGAASFLLLMQIAFGTGADMTTYIMSGEICGFRLWTMIVASVVLIPLTEEVFFRGVLYGSLQGGDMDSFWRAALYSSLFYSLQQPVLGYMAVYFVLGIVFAMLFRMTGRLLPSVLAHGAIGLASVLLSWHPVLSAVMGNTAGLPVLCVAAVAGIASASAILLRMWNA